MKKIIIIIFILITTINAEIYNKAFDKTYVCIAYEKIVNKKTEKLDVNQSLAQGGYYRFSMKINFLRAIVSRDKDTIHNIKYKDVRFAYRETIGDFDVFYHDYNKEFLIIKNDYLLKPSIRIGLDKRTQIDCICQAYTK